MIRKKSGEMKKVDKRTGRVGICQRESFKDRWKDEHLRNRDSQDR